jgi:hypothetical protein
VSGRSLDRPGRNQGDNYDGLDASGVFVLLSATFSPDGQSRSAARTRFPVFDSVVALTKESGQELSPARPDLDVRVMVWAPTALVPVPFLRMTHTPGGDLEASGFAWWLRSSDVAPTDGRLTPDGAHPAGTLLLLVHDLYGAIADRPTELLVLKQSFLASAEGRTDENCQAVDAFFCIRDDWQTDRTDLPGEFQLILDDIGGCLHDTVSAPEITGNFDSTPEQLLVRVRKVEV